MARWRASGVKIGSDNDDLKANLTRYIREGLSRKEILDFVRWDHSIYRDVGTTWYLVRLFN